MDELIHADIFFFVTTIVVVVLGLGMAIALYYVVAILRELRMVAQKVRKASDNLERDFEYLRSNIQEEGVRVKTIANMILGFVTRKVHTGRTKKKVKETVED